MAGEHAGGRVALDQVILGPLADRLAGEPGVVEAAEHDDRRPGSQRSQGVEGVEPLAVGQGEVEQDRGVNAPGGPLQPVAEPGHVVQVEQTAGRLGQRLADEGGVAGVVFDQEQADVGLGHVAPCLFGGGLDD